MIQRTGGSDPEQDYFADGAVEDIITALSRYHALFVITRNSSFTHKGHAVDVKQVGRELGVRYVLEGSYAGPSIGCSIFRWPHGGSPSTFTCADAYLGRANRYFALTCSLRPQPELLEDLKELGVGPVGHRRKLLDAIAALRSNANTNSLSPTMPPIAARATPLMVEAVGEHRYLTVMFCDLVDSTGTAARLDAEERRGEALTASSPEVKIPRMEPSDWPPVGLLASGGDAHSRQQA